MPVSEHEIHKLFHIRERTICSGFDWKNRLELAHGYIDVCRFLPPFRSVLLQAPLGMAKCFRSMAAAM